MPFPKWFPFADALHRAVVAWRNRPDRPSRGLSVFETTPYDDDDGIFLAMGLGGEAGEVLNEFKKWMRGDYERAEFIAKLRGELGDVQCMLALVARYAGLDLDEVTAEKLLEFEHRLLKRNIIKEPVTARPEIAGDSDVRIFVCGNGHETQVRLGRLREFQCAHRDDPPGAVCGAAAFPKVGT